MRLFEMYPPQEHRYWKYVKSGLHSMILCPVGHFLVADLFGYIREYDRDKDTFGIFCNNAYETSFIKAATINLHTFELKKEPAFDLLYHTPQRSSQLHVSYNDC